MIKKFNNNPYTKKRVSKEVEQITSKYRVKKSRTLKPFLPHDQAAYFFYRKNRKTNNAIGEHRTRFKEAVTEIFNAISELMCENEGGVYLEDYGYFAAMETKYMIEKERNFIDKAFRVNEKDFVLQVFTDTAPKSCIKFMTMDRTFSKNVKQNLAHQINSLRKKPKLYYTLLMSLYSNKKINY